MSVNDGTFLRTLDSHTGKITSLDFTTDGSILVSSSVDGSVRLWGVLEE